MLDAIDPKDIQKLFVNPARYWEDHQAEPADLTETLRREILFLALVPTGAAVLGTLFGGLGPALRFGFFFRLLLSVLATGVVTYALNIVLWVALVHIIHALAGPFGGLKDLGQCVKLARGMIIPVWAGSLLSLISVRFLALLGAVGGVGYGAYVLYLGLPLLLSVPQDKRVPFTVATVAITLVVTVLLSIFAGCPMNCLTPRP